MRRTAPFILAPALLLTSTIAVLAQPAPFDMTPEAQRYAPATPPVAATPAPAPVPTTPAAPAATPAAVVPLVAPVETAPTTAPEPTPATPAATAAPTPTAAPTTPDGAYARPLVPFDALRLEGEDDSSSWTVFLTAQQAASTATLNVAFQNSLVIAPEISALTVFINDRPMLDTPLRASEAEAHVAVDVPAGLLQPGVNRIRVAVNERHRTDCTIASTYELWTDIDPAGTNLTFADPTAGAIANTNDLRAVGVDADGQTVVNVLLPAIGNANAADDLLRLVQGLGILLASPSTVIRVSATDTGPVGPGQMTVILGTADEIAPFVGSQPIAGPSAGFVTGAAEPTLIVSGRDWTEVGVAVDSIVDPLQRPASAQRSTMDSLSWHYPDVPILTGNQSLTLAQLGVPTTEFSGRRFHTSFAVAMPADLYAQAYGFVSLMLDAAYSQDVLPGAHIDIYVNGEIAVTTPVVTAGGGILRHLDVEVPLRHFTPGINTIEIEANLPTASDTVCLPGATGSTDSRFVLFDTTEFKVTNFARAAQFPDLSALAGMGYPIGATDLPVSVVLDRLGPETYSAAATFMARIATLAGRPYDVSSLSSPTAATAPFGLYVGVMSQLPSGVAKQVGIANGAIGGWIDPVLAGPAVPAAATDPGNDVTLDRWRDALSGGGGIEGRLTGFSDWLRRTFDISLTTLRFGSAHDLDYQPPADASLALVQGGLSSGQTSWTVLAAPSVASLQSGTEALVRPGNWQGISGQVSVYRPLVGTVEAVPLQGADVMMTQAATPGNLRLVSTNWLSKNLIIYGALLVGLCVLLGIATSWLLKSVGRQ